MSDDFQQLRKILGGESRLPATPIEFTEVCYRRLLDALQTIGSSQNPCPSDLACLVRHVLRREAELQQGIPQIIQVPRKTYWPDQAVWRQSGIDVLSESSNEFLVQA